MSDYSMGRAGYAAALEHQERHHLWLFQQACIDRDKALAEIARRDRVRMSVRGWARRKLAMRTDERDRLRDWENALSALLWSELGVAGGMTLPESLAVLRKHFEHRRLFAAAPELLTAAAKALNYIENTEASLGITLDSGDALRAAITKARGENV